MLSPCGTRKQPCSIAATNLLCIRGAGALNETNDSVVVDIGADRRDLAETAVRSFRLFYPQVEVHLGDCEVRLCSPSMSKAQIRAAWTAELHVARFTKEDKQQREQLFRDLFQ